MKKRGYREKPATPFSIVIVSLNNKIGKDKNDKSDG